MTYQSPHGGPVDAAYDLLDLDVQQLDVPRPDAWSRVSRHAALLLVTGMALGPQGVALLTPTVLELLQPAVAVALTVLGVAVVLGSPEHGAVIRLSRTLASCLILILALAEAVQRGAGEGLAVVGEGAVLATVLAGAGWVLCARGANMDERRVFAVATVLLIGGVAEQLGVSALLMGLIAAGAWSLARRAELEHVRRDLTYLQQPLTALLLVVAGAHAMFSWYVTATAAVLATVALVAVRVVRQRAVGEQTSAFITPATFLVALAMDAARLDERTAEPLSIVILVALTIDAFQGVTREAAA